MSARLANTCTRPVELHLPGGVVVIPALAEIECAEQDLELGQVAALCGRGVLVAHLDPPQPTSSPRRRPFSTRKRKS